MSSSGTFHGGKKGEPITFRADLFKLDIPEQWENRTAIWTVDDHNVLTIRDADTAELLYRIHAVVTYQVLDHNLGAKPARPKATSIWKRLTQRGAA